MKILPINNLYVARKINKNSVKYNNNNLKYDTVSFSGTKKTEKKETSQNVISGVSLGKKILKYARTNEISYEDLNRIVNIASPVDIEIKPLDELPFKNFNLAGNVIAHMLPLYGLDYRLRSANIYLGALPQASKERTDFVANLAHEYTHVLQRAQDDDYYGILKYTQNPQEVSIIARASKLAMDKMVKTCQTSLFSNQAQVNKVLNSIIDGKFNIKEAVDNSNFEDIIEDSARLALLNLNRDDTKEAMRGWIKKEASNEEEAYSVTLGVMDSSKFDLVTKAKRILSKEIYSYIAQSL